MREIDLTALYYLAQNFQGEIDKLYLHWSAGWPGQFYDDYHINIDADGTIYLSTDNLAETLAHTWHRNSNSIGIAMACCADAKYNGKNTDWGEAGPTPEQIETMAKVVDVLCVALGLPINYDHVMTHAEAAEEDGYGPSTTCERWDLAYLPNYKSGTNVNGGEMIRDKANWYKQNGY